MWRPLEDPDELDSLSAEDLIQRVEPLLRGGKVATSPHWRERVRENIHSVCAELALEWQRAPQLGKRTVPFREYLAAKLRARLHELDQEQNAHLYDDHRRYRAEREPLPLDPEQHDHLVHEGVGADPASRELEADAHVRMHQALTTAGIAAASHTAVHAVIDDFANGTITSAYRLARALGHPPSEARNHPATAAYQALQALQPGVASPFLL